MVIPPGNGPNQSCTALSTEQSRWTVQSLLSNRTRIRNVRRSLESQLPAESAASPLVIDSRIKRHASLSYQRLKQVKRLDIASSRSFRNTFIFQSLAIRLGDE